MASAANLDFLIYSHSISQCVEDIYSTACLASLPGYHTGTLNKPEPEYAGSHPTNMSLLQLTLSWYP